VNSHTESLRLTDDERLDWLRLIRSDNVGPRGIIATILIVWMGIVKEHHWDLLRERAHERTAVLEVEAAKANEAAGKAHERAAQAEQRAAEANLEIARLRAPRILTIEQQRRIADAIRAYKGISFDTATLVGDTEALTLLEMIEAAIRAADWSQINWADTARGLRLERPGQPSVGNISITEVMIQFEPEQRGGLKAPAETLASALRAAGVAAIASEAFFAPSTAANKTAIHVMVGKKF